MLRLAPIAQMICIDVLEPTYCAFGEKGDISQASDDRSSLKYPSLTASAYEDVMQNRPEDITPSLAGVASQARFITDRSSAITVVNDISQTPLVLNDYGVELGKCVHEPEAVLQPGGSTTMRVDDKIGLLGSKGWMRYTIGRDGAEILITFECPSVANNRVVAVPVGHATVGVYEPRGALKAEIRIH